MAEKQDKSTRTARWCFTLNNPPDDWAPPTGGEIKYMIWQREQGSECMTTHIQGYVRFINRKRLNSAKAWFCCPEMHLEPARGTEEQNRAYCSKQEGQLCAPVEYGEYEKDAGKQGKRSDLEPITEKIKQGVSVKDVAAEHPVEYVKYHLGIHALADLLAPLPPAEREVKVIVMWGETATGKTHRARTTFPELYEVQPGRDPWGKYSGQAVILFDEFDSDKWTIQEMNRYLDKWRCSLSARYHDRYAEWTRVVICSNTDPYTWWPYQHQSLRQALWRRLSSIVEVRSIEQVVDLTA